jgi:phage repressor protein C with HTH and peptisase S24 domain
MLAMTAHNTQRIAFCNPPCIVSLRIDDRMATKAERLKQARIAAGFDSAQDAADAYGWNAPAYRHHENGTRGFGPDAAKKYGKAFKVRAGWLLGLDHVEKDPPTPLPDEDRLVVNGSVEAGAWRATEAWDDDRAFVIEGMPSPLPGAKRFGLVTVGLSMNEFYEPGTVLDCVSIFKGGTTPKTGDHVIVERIRPDGLRELTVKEYYAEGGRYMLVPRSTSQAFKPIEYAGPDHEQSADGEQIHVIGFVLAAYPPRTLDLMKRMGLVKPLLKG